MSNADRWLLPEGIEESLPAEAAWLEHYRRALLDMFSSWGYELVIPPFIEYLESLLIGPSDDLDLQTFKLTDQLTGRMMGVRADMTSQVARIDAHMMKRDVPARFCYLGTVLHTRPSGRDLTRSPLQLGAELYGHAGIDSDVEVICLMLETLQVIGVSDVCLDLGHVGIFASLVEQAGLDEEKKKSLQNLLKQRTLPEYEKLLSACELDDKWLDIFKVLPNLSGNEEVIAMAKDVFRNSNKDIAEYISYVEQLAAYVKQRYKKVNIHFDFAALSGYRYQNAAVFAAYIAGQGGEIARGGRYDEIGKAFGRSRPATGFSLDLKALAKISTHALKKPMLGILAPNENDAALYGKVQQLRQQGERVIYALQDQQGGAQAMQCDQVLEKENQQWIVKGLK